MLTLSAKVLVILGINLTLYMIIFIMYIMTVEQVGSSPSILFTSIVLYITDFLLTFFMIIIVVLGKRLIIVNWVV